MPRAVHLAAIEPRRGRVDDDVVLLVQACAAAFGDRVLTAVRAGAGQDVRHNDGYVFQHLVVEPRSITDLAGLLGVTQQAMSKQVVDLEARGLVERRADPRDARARLVRLTRRGRRAVEAGRAARRDLRREIVDRLGERRATTMLRALREVSDHYGAVDQLSRRRLRPEANR